MLGTAAGGLNSTHGRTTLRTSGVGSQVTLVLSATGLVGLAGALAAQRAGRLHDGGWSVGGAGTGASPALALATSSLSGGDAPGQHGLKVDVGGLVDTGLALCN